MVTVRERLLSSQAAYEWDVAGMEGLVVKETGGQADGGVAGRRRGGRVVVEREGERGRCGVGRQSWPSSFVGDLLVALIGVCVLLGGAKAGVSLWRERDRVEVVARLLPL